MGCTERPSLRSTIRKRHIAASSRSETRSSKSSCSKPVWSCLQTGAVVAMQDLGAAGLTSSTVEVASRGGVGAEIDVAKVPRRESGMTRMKS